jgi:energy-coupling factor transporter ATP-binding protein EcfA2
MPVAISLKNFSLRFTPKRPVLKDINLTINSGDWWGIAGSNGSGKTTLLYVLAKIIPHLMPAKISGTVSINHSTGLVFQNPDFSIFNLTVEEEAAFGHTNPVENALKAVGLWSFRSADPQTLSYGAKQKLCLAAVLAKNPDIILLDEPTSMLDYKSSLNLYSVLKKLHRAGKTIVVVEHNTALLNQYTQKLLLIDDGKIAASGPTRSIFNNRSLIGRLNLEPVK